MKNTAYIFVIALLIFISYTLIEAKEVKNPNEGHQAVTEFSTDHLTEEQKYITLRDGTEPPFKNAYWDNKEPGIYVDIISGDPLFSSTDKFKSGSGWPSFTKPIDREMVKEFVDDKLFMTRIEVRSSRANAHLGHVFNDGPRDKGGMRYCINSASLKFIHKDDLKTQGYEKYLSLFNEE